MKISSRSFGLSITGEKSTLWTVSSPSGISISLSDWGATLVSVLQPDRRGEANEVVLGFPDASGYTAEAGYLGATCGRFSNRIKNGQFTLNGTAYQLACNNGPNHLHGGEKGFSAILWKAEPYQSSERCGVLFRHTSMDGEEGYPGTLEVEADYSLNKTGLLSMEFRASAGRDTIVNITNHSYWNLAGKPFQPVNNHILSFNSSHYLPVDSTSIPTGELCSVSGTPFDFRKGKSIGKDLEKIEGGYDHCMVIDGTPGELRTAVYAEEPSSGRAIRLSTNRPGIQFYSGNYLSGNPFIKHSGFCLEPEDFPDAPNRPGFPSTLLRPGELYSHHTTIQFLTVPE